MGCPEACRSPPQPSSVLDSQSSSNQKSMAGGLGASLIPDTDPLQGADLATSPASHLHEDIVHRSGHSWVTGKGTPYWSEMAPCTLRSKPQDLFIAHKDLEGLASAVFPTLSAIIVPPLGSGLSGLLSVFPVLFRYLLTLYLEILYLEHSPPRSIFKSKLKCHSHIGFSWQSKVSSHFWSCASILFFF
jgi:hypothetical protein